jgi:serine/threonine-protein kinase
MTDDGTVILRGAGNDTASTFPPHTMLLHTYEVERMLAYGGMGEVYLARHVELGTSHAIKIIKPGLVGTAGGQDILELFRREATVLRGIRHDAIVSYDGFFRDEAKTCYLVMEYVDGPSLSQVLEQHSLSVDEVFRLRDRLADGLACAHERGVTHRDLSPDNVILPNGRVEQAKLIDFGIAKLADPSVATIIGSDFAGKLRYAAPEQLGLFGGQAGPVSDIYSLGLVLAAAVLGKPLPMGDSLASAITARQQIPALASVPAALQPLLGAMLQPDPDRRAQSAAELRRNWPAPHTTAGPPPHPPLAEGAPAGRGHYWLALLAAIGVAGWVAGMWWLQPTPESPSQPIRSPVLETPKGADDAKGRESASVAPDRPVTAAVALPPPTPPPARVSNAAVGTETSQATTERPLRPDETPEPTPQIPAALEPASTPEASQERVAATQEPAATEPPAVKRTAPLSSSTKKPAEPPLKSQEAPRTPPANPPLRSLAREGVKSTPPKTGNRSSPTDGGKPGGCGSVLLKSQLGEPLSAADRALLQTGCR